MIKRILGITLVLVASTARAQFSPNLQLAYLNGSTGIITLRSSRGAVIIRDASPALGANLLAVQDNTGATTYFAVTASAITFSGTLSGTYTIGGTPTLGSTLTGASGANISLSSNANVTAQHTLSNSAAPTCAVGAAAGTGGSVGCTISGTDEAGLLTITIGTAAGSGNTVATITYAAAYPTGSSVIIWPNDSTTGAEHDGFSINQGFWTTGTTTNWTYNVTFAALGGGLTAGKVLKYNYIVKGW